MTQGAETELNAVDRIFAEANANLRKLAEEVEQLTGFHAKSTKIREDTNNRVKEIQATCAHRFVAKPAMIEDEGIPIFFCKQNDGLDGTPPELDVKCSKCNTTSRLSVAKYCPKCGEYGVPRTGRYSRHDKRAWIPDVPFSGLPERLRGFISAEIQWADFRKCSCGFEFIIVDNTVPLK